MQAIERIRTALQKHAAAKTLAESWMLTDEIENALSIEALTEVLAHIDKLEAEIESLKRGEYICLKCCLRKDAEGVPVDF